MSAQFVQFKHTTNDDLSLWVCTDCKSLATDPKHKALQSDDAPEICQWCKCPYIGCTNTKAKRQSYCQEHIDKRTEDRRAKRQAEIDAFPVVAYVPDTPVYDHHTDTFYEDLGSALDAIEDDRTFDEDWIPPDQRPLSPCSIEPADTPDIADNISESWYCSMPEEVDCDLSPGLKAAADALTAQALAEAPTCWRSRGERIDMSPVGAS